MEWPGRWRRIQELVDAHYSALYRYAFRLCGSAADADDLTQETFCKAQMPVHQLRNADRAKPWLFTILRNAYLHRLRNEKSHRSVPLECVAEPSAAAPSPREIGTDELQQALNELPEPFRTPV